MPTTEELIQQLQELAENGPEPKSKRLQILIRPSLYDALKALSDKTGVSVNQIVNEALYEKLKGKE